MALFSLKALWCSKSNTSWIHFHHVCREHLPTLRMTSQFPVGVLLPSFSVTFIECEGNDVIIRHLGVLKRGYTFIHRRWMGHDFVSQGCDINLTCFPSYTHMKVLHTTLVYYIVLCMYRLYRTSEEYKRLSNLAHFRNVRNGFSVMLSDKSNCTNSIWNSKAQIFNSI